ncbi:excinuclease ABC subunit UvrA [Streptomyces griseorubiginosus]|uniref:excinuclease ABC subunit UvrA n=1 Tax=Streptomyces griseorubiginosus TaxID=67304 RepID=UPI001AD79347|nr:excinuclease ABC subunit UvrA [Streptomyces griseorubiginosus]MBO4258223.1 excinuclease ABC subunit UvrA [Streptomyces griseorubiginosus]
MGKPVQGAKSSGAVPVPSPDAVTVRGARVHNLKDIDVTVPLGKLVAIAGVSGSGKSSLALGVLYAEGSRRYLEALSTYTRRRLTQAAHAAVDSVEHVPAALALRQRPGIPGVRSTFGTSTELLNSLRLIFSRLGHHQCPNGHYLEPTMDVALDLPLTCPECGVVFGPPSAESYAFNSEGACPRCAGTGTVREVDEDALVPDPSRSIDEGAVLPWQMFGLAAVPKVAAELGVRTDVPFSKLTKNERAIVFEGEPVKRVILYPAKNGKLFELNATYRNARQAVEEALKKATTKKGLDRVDRFLSVQTCPDCHGTRLSEQARSSLVDGINLADATAKTLDDVTTWVRTIPAIVPTAMAPMAESIVTQMVATARRLIELGLGYLTLDRASSTLSTGERQRVALSRAVRNRTTGVLYVLDEPSIGLHPANVDGLLGVIRSLLADGNSVIVVDHDVQVLRQADHLIEIGPGSGRDGGTVIAEGTLKSVERSKTSLIAGFLTGREQILVRPRADADDVFKLGRIHLRTAPLHTVHALALDVPRGRLTAVTGASGSGKTTLVLESLVPALKAHAAGQPLPQHIRKLTPEGITRVNVVDASPIGSNVRSTVATYSGVLDDLRRAYAATPAAKERGLKAGDFSYNTGSLRCPTCEGTGQIELDVQFLPDVDIICPDCEGSRYAPEADEVRRVPRGGEEDDGLTLPQLLTCTVAQAIEHTGDLNKVRSRLQTLIDLGLGYLTLGEATPALSGGEAQRLKLASELDRDQCDALFVLDEPSVGLHPLDVRVLLGVLQRLVDNGATVVFIEHDLDMIANADFVVDLGPGGGVNGGRITATGTPEQIAANTHSVTGQYLREALVSAERPAKP